MRELSACLHILQSVITDCKRRNKIPFALLQMLIWRTGKTPAAVFAQRGTNEDFEYISF